MIGPDALESSASRAPRAAEAPAAPACDSGWRSAFAHPRGWRGALAGMLMSLKNRGLNRLAVDRLGVAPAARVLEIGCGPGDALACLAARTRRGFVVGADPSEPMRRLAAFRNRGAIAEGRVVLVAASAARLPLPDAGFDRVLAVSAFHHWPDPDTALREIFRVLRPGGVLLIAERLALAKPRRLAAPGVSRERISALQRRLAAAGFRDARTEIARDGAREAAMVLATRAPSGPGGR